MKKVCIVGQFPPPIHGLSKALQSIIDSSIINEKYELTSIDIKDNKKILQNIKTIEKSDADIYYFTISQSLLGNLRDLFILKKILKKQKKIVIHYHGGYYKELYNKMNLIQKYYNRKYLSKIDRLVALSESLKCIFLDVISLDKITICENFIEDSSLLSENDFNTKIMGIKEKRNLDVLYLSNFIKSKGYQDVLKTSLILKDENVVFHFAGAFTSEKSKSEFEDFIVDNNLSKKVIYHGTVSGKEKKDLLEKADIFTLPTYYPNEGQPISIIEAMGNGLTIISTKHAGIPDIVNKSNGYLVNAKSPEDISKKIKLLIQDRSLLIDFGICNRETILDKYKEIDYNKRILNIFNEVLNNEK